MGSYNQDEFENLKHKKVMETLRRGKIKSIQEYKKEKEERINELIQITTLLNFGISHKDLANRIKLDRKSLSPYLRNLKMKGFIEKKVKDGLYISSSQELTENLNMAEFFGKKFRETILNERVPLVLNEDEHFYILKKEKEDKKSSEFDFTTYKKYFSFTSQGDIRESICLEKELFEFSNRIGAFVTYTLIQFMNPDNIKGSMRLTRRVNEELTKKMVKVAILELSKFLGENFRDLIYRSLNIPHSNIRDKIRDKKSVITFEKERIDKLNDAFSNLYPRMTKELERISENRYYFKGIFNDHYSEFEAYKKSFQKHQEKVERQKSCQHTYYETDNKSSKDDLLKCGKCGYYKRKRKPGIEPKVKL